MRAYSSSGYCSVSVRLDSIRVLKVQLIGTLIQDLIRDDIFLCVLVIPVHCTFTMNAGRFVTVFITSIVDIILLAPVTIVLSSIAIIMTGVCANVHSACSVRYSHSSSTLACVHCVVHHASATTIVIGVYHCSVAVGLQGKNF